MQYAQSFTHSLRAPFRAFKATRLALTAIATVALLCASVRAQVTAPQTRPWAPGVLTTIAPEPQEAEMFDGPRPLVESGDIESNSTTLVNLQAGWRWLSFPWGELVFTLDVLNLFNSKDDDITYFYASRLPGEPAEGVEDIHFHPVEPRSLRGYLTWRY